MLPCHLRPNRLSGNAHAMLELADARLPFNMDDGLDLGAITMAGSGSWHEGQSNQRA